MPGIAELVTQPDTTFAVIGATDTPGKYGGKVYRNLKSKGYRVFAINPTSPEVDGDQAWANLSDLPEIPTVVVFVVSPRVGAGVLAEAAEVGIENVWFQPGSYSEELSDAVAEGGFDWSAEACVMMATSKIA